MYKNTYIIAEIGINHNGNLNKAISLIKAAKKSGTDAVKFQLYNTNSLANKKDLKKYKLFKRKKSETLYQMWERLRLKKKWIKKISNFCLKIKIDLGFSVFDKESLNILDKINYKFIKVASSDITDLNLIKNIKKKKKWIIISTGMASKVEILQACELVKKCNYSLLHCVSLYPTPISKINLKRMICLKKFCNNVGFSDHTEGITSSIMAINLGAKILEKHFTDNKKQDGPDHLCSADPKDMEYISHYNINKNKTLGSEKIDPEKKEKNMRKFARKSIFAKKQIKKNEFFSYENIETRRPGSGLGANKLENLIGKKSKYQFSYGEKIKI
jgi:N,N'-diacetyllegionaminate synthase